jgi:hypothetical protein
MNREARITNRWVIKNASKNRVQLNGCISVTWSIERLEGTQSFGLNELDEILQHREKGEQKR